MRKIFALWQNEMLKVTKKVSMLVLLILMVPAVLGIGGFFKIIEKIDSSYAYYRTDDYYTSDEYYKEVSESFKIKDTEAKQKQTEYKNAAAALEAAYANGGDISSLEKKVNDASSAFESAVGDAASAKNELTQVELCKKYKIETNNNGYLASLVFDASSAESEIYELSFDADANKKEIERNQARIDRAKDIMERKSYKDYIALKSEDIKSQKLPEQEEKIYLETLELKLKYDPDGINLGSEFNSALDTVETYKKSLLDNINYTVTPNVPLSVEQKEDIQNSLLVMYKKLDDKIIVPNADGDNYFDYKPIAVSAMQSVAMSVVLILMIITAGGSISQEISSGSIKSLIISPTRRWKIFTAKALSILTVGIIATVAAAVLSTAGAYIWFGGNALTPYVYASGGTAHKIPAVLYAFASCFTDLIPIIVYSAFAFMLSVITRNTAASVSVPIAIYFLGSTAFTILTKFVSGEWLKFLPFMNLDFTKAIFPNSDLSEMISRISVAASPSLTFSVIYVAVLMLCMLYTAFDSFTRRDI